MVVLSASAQSPSAAQADPKRSGRLNIPEKPPQFWTPVDGGTEGQWTALREHCRAVFSEMAATQKMRPDQIKALPPVPSSD